jgi:hypothetical protein
LELAFPGIGLAVDSLRVLFNDRSRRGHPFADRGASVIVEVSGLEPPTSTLRTLQSRSHRPSLRSYLERI